MQKTEVPGSCLHCNTHCCFCCWRQRKTHLKQADVEKGNDPSWVGKVQGTPGVGHCSTQGLKLLSLCSSSPPPPRAASTLKAAGKPQQGCPLHPLALHPAVRASLLPGHSRKLSFPCNGSAVPMQGAGSACTSLHRFGSRAPPEPGELKQWAEGAGRRSSEGSGSGDQEKGKCALSSKQN